MNDPGPGTRRMGNQGLFSGWWDVPPIRRLHGTGQGVRCLDRCKKEGHPSRARYNHYHVQEYSDGRIVLEPRVLAAPFEVSRKALAQMDSSMKNLKKGKASKPIDLANFSAK